MIQRNALFLPRALFVFNSNNKKKNNKNETEKLKLVYYKNMAIFFFK